MMARSGAPSPGSGKWSSFGAATRLWGSWGAGLCSQLCNKLFSP